MANAAFEARLLLRPSHQRTVWTVNKLKCPIPGRPTLPPILSSRSYSDSTSTPTPPFPKSSGSTEGSQSSGPNHMSWGDPKLWVAGLGGSLVTVLLEGWITYYTVRTGSFLCHLKHADYQRVFGNMSATRPGKKSTKNLGDVNTNLHANLQSTISSKRDRNLRRQLHTLSHAHPLSRK
jgi:hypothetical protein